MSASSVFYGTPPHPIGETPNGIQQVVGGESIEVFTVFGVSTVNNTGVVDTSAGSGIQITGARQTPTITNTGVLDLTAGSGIIISGTKNNYTIANSGAGGGVTSIASSGLNPVTGAINLVSGDQNTLTITGDVPNNTIILTASGGGSPVTLTAGTGITVGTAPDYTITNTAPGITYTAGTGIDIDVGNQISNTGVLSVSAGTGGVTVTGTAADPVINVDLPTPVTLTAGTGITVGTAPDYTITNTAPGITYTAGTGIDIDVNNVITNTAPGGGSSSYYQYQADNGATPNTGHISWSNFATQTSSTYIRVNHIDQNGVDIDVFLNLVQQGNQLIIQDANVSANYQTWLVSGTPIPNTGSGYVQYPISLTGSGGASNFANNHQIILAIISSTPSVTLTAGTGITVGTGPNYTVTNTGVTSIIAGTGISVDTSTGAVTVTNTSVSPFNTEGIQNKLGIFPVTPATTSTQLAVNNQTPTTYVPDGVTPTSSTTPEGAPCWLYTKPTPALTGFNWYPYNPRFGNPTATLPYRKANTGTRLKTLWALIQPTVNIYTSGIIGLNVYSYDDANPPTSGFYNTRWSYSNTVGAAAGTSGVNLFANYTYLVYAYDAPRTTNILGVGQPDNQQWGLRDPYDIYTDVHHIPLQNVVVAFNPWTDGTNYITWNPATTYTVGQTVVYSGTSVNPNGLFYTATAATPNLNQPPVSAAGVANTTYWTALSPQPSSYASQPVLSANINGISGSTANWVAGPLLRVLSMGYSVGPDTTTTSASFEYKLN